MTPFVGFAGVFNVQAFAAGTLRSCRFLGLCALLLLGLHVHCLFCCTHAVYTLCTRYVHAVYTLCTRYVHATTLDPSPPHTNTLVCLAPGLS